MAEACSDCGFESPAGFKFCGQCGKPLHEAPPTSSPAAERRHLTVVFCDLVGSTELSERLDPEEFRDVVRDYQSVCEEVIDRFGGHVAQHLGDGLMVYFGYPTAQEEDPQRAVRAGLGVVGAVRDLSRRLESEREIKVQVRVGIHTGEVITGEVGSGQRREQLALGRAPNVAARLQSIAEPNNVVLSDDVHRLVRGFFACESLGSVDLKGISESVKIYRVLHARGVRSRFEIAMWEGLTPVVGRDDEFETLMDRFRRAKGGRRTSVLIAGEPGIGKSRFVEAFREATRGEDRYWFIGRCSPFYANSPLNPIIDMLHRATRISPEDDAKTKLDKLRQLLEALELDSTDVLALLAGLLSVPPDGQYTPLDLSPERQKQRVCEALIELLHRQAAQRPVVFVLEDVHWADPSTLECLSLLLDSDPDAKMLAVFVCRPSFQSPWAESDEFSTIHLERLNDSEVRQMIADFAGDRTIPDQILNQIVEKTDGVPIFVEELTKMVLEAGIADTNGGGNGHDLPALQIPATLQDSLVARLDRLTSAKDTALLGAVLGREFGFELIAAVSDVDRDELNNQLKQLVQAQLLLRTESPTEVHFAFRHALIQDAAYGLLLKTARRRYHNRIADTMTERFPDRVERDPEIVAHHYTEAEMPEPAVRYWLLAARRHRQRFANVEAIRHSSTGLDLLQKTAPSTQRDAQEMVLQTTLGAALTASKGYGAPDARAAYARAVEIGSQLGDNPQLFVTMAGLWGFHLVRGDYDTALNLGLRLVQLGESLDQPAWLIEAHYAVGLPQFYLGEFEEARSHFELALAVDFGDHDITTTTPNGDDPRVHVSCFLALVYWHQGFPDRARRQSDYSIELAAENGHPYGQAFAAVLAAWLHTFLGEYEAVVERAREGLAVADEKGFPYWQLMGHFLLGWSKAWAAQGEAEATRVGVGHMRKLHQAYGASGARTGETLWLLQVVATLLRAGMFDQGMETITQALDTIGATGERTWEAEFYRLRGEFHRKMSNPDPVQTEDTFNRALCISHEQGAMSLELRAAMSLGRFWEAQGSSEKAREIVSETYGKFTEGLDTKDLIEARNLLERRG